MLGTLLGAGVAAAGNIYGSYLQSEAQKQAAAQYAAASQAALKAYRNAYNQAYGAGSYNAQMQDLGLGAANDYNNLVHNSDAWNLYVDGDRAYQAPETFSFTAQDLYNDPSYQFRLQQGQDALAQNQVAGGLNLSGAAAKQMNDYTQNVASTEYSNAYNRAYSQYNNDRQFDYNAWLNEANRYYNNLSSQLNGLNTLSSQGIQANTNQSNALQGMAGITGNAAAQQAAASSSAAMADANQSAAMWSSLGNILGTGIANYGTAGDTPTPQTANNTTYINNPYWLSSADQVQNTVNPLDYSGYTKYLGETVSY